MASQYVGIDLHRRRSVIVRQTPDGQVVDTVRIDNDRSRWDARSPPPARTHRSWSRRRMAGCATRRGVFGWGVRTHLVVCRSRPLEGGGSLALEVRGRVGAASTTPGRAGTARRSGSGKQGGEAYGCRNQWWTPLKKSDRREPGGCGPGWQRAGSPYNREGRPRRHGGGVGGHGEWLRRNRGQACRGKLGADPADRHIVNVGTGMRPPSCPPARRAAARRTVC